MNDTLHLIYATDEGYLIPTFVSAVSAVLWASDKSALRIVILDIGIADPKWLDFEQRLRRAGGEKFLLYRHKVDVSKFMDFKSYKGSLGTYARLDIPRIFPDLSWCVYADGDTLFTDDPLKLREVYDSRYAIQGQPDNENWDYDETGVSLKQRWFERNGLGWNSSQYVCAGFLLMNLDWFRSNNGTERCLCFLKEYPDCKNHDQDALSYVCRGYVSFINDRWGILSRNAFLRGKPGCIHYAADAPWKLMSSRRKDYNDAHKLWFDFAYRHLGLGFVDLLTEPYKKNVMWRKFSLRFVFKLIYPIARFFGFKSPIGRYLHKHYISGCEYSRILNCKP